MTDVGYELQPDGLPIFDRSAGACCWWCSGTAHAGQGPQGSACPVRTVTVEELSLEKRDRLRGLVW